MGEVIPFPKREKESEPFKKIIELAEKYPLQLRSFNNWLLFNKDSISNDVDNVLIIASVYYMFLVSVQKDLSKYLDAVQNNEQISNTLHNIKTFIESNIKDQAISGIKHGHLVAVFADDMARINSRQYDEEELSLLDQLADLVMCIARDIDMKLSQQK